MHEYAMLGSFCTMNALPAAGETQTEQPPFVKMGVCACAQVLYTFFIHSYNT